VPHLAAPLGDALAAAGMPQLEFTVGVEPWRSDTRQAKPLPLEI